MSIPLLALAASPATADTCQAYDPPQLVAEVGGSSVDEASGLAVAKLRSGVFFTHGDRGGAAVLASFDAAGRLLDEHLVTNAENFDWEDLASAPCPDDGWCLYIGDIGDNHRRRENVTVYVVREPAEGDARVRAIDRFVAVYPDEPHNAETLLVHPCTGQISVVTKEDDGRSRVFQFPPLDQIDGTAVLEEVAQVVFAGPSASSRAATGGAYDDDGDQVVIRTNDRVFHWIVDPDDPVPWSLPPTELVGTTERQGEGIAFGPDASLFTVGEGSPIPFSEAVCTARAPAPDDAVCDFPQTGRRCGCATGGPNPVGWVALLGLVWATTGQRRLRATSAAGLRYSRTRTGSSGATSASRRTRTGTPYSGH